jgi:hypothetical protein
VTLQENVTFNCNFEQIKKTKINWFYGQGYEVSIVHHVFRFPPFYFTYPAKPPHTEADYVYNTGDGSLTIHGSKLNFSRCYECEAIEAITGNQYYQSYTPKLSGKLHINFNTFFKNTLNIKC